MRLAHVAMCMGMTRYTRPLDVSARDLSEQAMRHGTPDAGLSCNRGLIDGALGDVDSARVYLQGAVPLTYHLHPLNANRARRELQSLRRRPARAESTVR